MSDYIEREAAIEAIKKERDYTGKFTFEEEHAWAVGFQQGITFALSDVANIPAADVRPVVRGRWRFEKSDGKTCSDGWVCSSCSCGFHTHVPYFEDFNFCPNCGADMRTGAE